ncbi:hypothetical protein MAH4_16810 [Sessilibacter sp. MAH4]
MIISACSLADVLCADFEGNLCFFVDKNRQFLKDTIFKMAWLFFKLRVFVKCNRSLQLVFYERYLNYLK